MQPEIVSSETSQDHKGIQIYTKVRDWPPREENKKGKSGQEKKKKDMGVSMIKV